MNSLHYRKRRCDLPWARVERSQVLIAANPPRSYPFLNEPPRRQGRQEEEIE